MTCADGVSGAPALGVRSVDFFLHNRDLEREWFFDDDHWCRYFDLLVRCRLNSFALTYAHQTSYLAPPFPFLVRVPGYEHVVTPGYAPSDRRRHLAAVRRISRRAAERGIRFVFGVWLHHAHEYGASQVRGLVYEDLFDYCPRALACLLDACPGIRGMQFRMNREAGIEEDDQVRFFTGMLAAAHRVRPDLSIDLRAKGIRQGSIDAARGLGFDVVVSTKFWTEHMGLPFFLTRTNPIDTNRRYGYWDLLRHDRNYQMLYRLWTVGSNKVLLWGDVEHTRRFVETCRTGEGIGFEICAPLSNKGFGNHAGGAWHAIKEKGSRVGDWEFERYWPLLMSFGLAGYDPRAAQPVYEAEFLRRHGRRAGPAVRAALQQASRVLPWLVSAHLPSASTFGYWPEMYAGGSSDVYTLIQPSELLRFYSIHDYVQDYLAGTLAPMRTPEDIARRLDALGRATDRERRKAAGVQRRHARETNLALVDLDVLAALAFYHAARFRSGTAYRLFRDTLDRARLDEAIRQFRRALRQWQRVARATDGVYYDHMVFNRPPDQVGHWKDELPFLRRELRRLQAIGRLYDRHCGDPRGAVDTGAGTGWVEALMEWDERGGVLSRGPGADVPAEPLSFPLKHWIGRRYVMETAEHVVASAFNDRRRLSVCHAPVRYTVADRPTRVRASVVPCSDRLVVRLECRDPTAGDTDRVLRMRRVAPCVFEAVLPSLDGGQAVRYRVTARDPQSGAVARNGWTRLVSRHRDARARIRSRDIARCRAGEDLTVSADIEAPGRSRRVELHYRRMHQAEDWATVRMHAAGRGHYEAVVPGAAIDEDWDLMYAVSVIDDQGNHAFYPDLDRRAPYVVVRVEAPGKRGRP